MSEHNSNHDESFRDTLTTISDKGERKWVFAKKPKGKYWLWRNIVGFLLLIFFFLTPLIKLSGAPFLLFDFFHRKFILFGVIFWPQDSFIFFLMFISFIVFV